jgi:hypothetical protein
MARMATQDDVRRVALSLPETSEGDDRFAFLFSIRHYHALNLFCSRVTASF